MRREGESVRKTFTHHASRALHHAWQIEALRDLAHLRGGDFLRLTERLVHSSDNHVFEQLRVRRIYGGRIDLDRGDGAVALRDHLDCATTASGFYCAGR